MTKELLKATLSDIVSFKSDFATSIIAKLFNSILKKQGYDAKILIREVTMSHTDSDGNVKVHMDVYIDATERDIRKLMSNL